MIRFGTQPMESLEVNATFGCNNTDYILTEHKHLVNHAALIAHIGINKEYMRRFFLVVIKIAQQRIS